MSVFAYDEVRAAADRFAEANVRAEEERDWSPLAEFYTDDAVYSYVGLTSGGAVEARGKEAIRKLVMGRDMEDYAGWTFPFQWIVVEGARIITRWSNRSPERRDDGSPIECPGMSVLEYAGEGKFKSQFDLYDRLSVKAVIDEAATIRALGEARLASQEEPPPNSALVPAPRNKAEKKKSGAKAKKKAGAKAKKKGAAKAKKKAGAKAKRKAKSSK